MKKGSPTSRCCFIRSRAKEIDDTIERKDGRKLASKIFDYIFLALMQRGLGGIKQLKVVQKVNGEVELLVVRSHPFDPKSIQFFKEKLLEYSGSVEVQVRFVDRILPSKSGKISYFEREVEG